MWALRGARQKGVAHGTWHSQGGALRPELQLVGGPRIVGCAVRVESGASEVYCYLLHIQQLAWMLRPPAVLLLLVVVLLGSRGRGSVQYNHGTCLMCVHARPQ
jgi:hypothetical protein